MTENDRRRAAPRQAAGLVPSSLPPSAPCVECGEIVEPYLATYPHHDLARAAHGERLCYPCERRTRPPMPETQQPAWAKKRNAERVPGRAADVEGVDSFTVGGTSLPTTQPRAFSPTKYAAVRERVGRTHAEVASAVDRAEPWAKKLATGKRHPCHEEIATIAKFLGVPVSDLTEADDSGRIEA